MTGLEGRVLRRRQALDAAGRRTQRARDLRRPRRPARRARPLVDRAARGLRRAAPGQRRRPRRLRRHHARPARRRTRRSTGRARRGLTPARRGCSPSRSRRRRPGQDDRGPPGRPRRRPAPGRTRSGSSPAGCCSTTSPAPRPGGSRSCNARAPRATSRSTRARAAASASRASTTSRSPRTRGVDASPRRGSARTSGRTRSSCRSTSPARAWSTPLTNAATDPISGMPEFKVCAVTIRSREEAGSHDRYVVVIGAGMVGHRFVDDLGRLDPGGSTSPCSARRSTSPTTGSCSPSCVAGRVDLPALTPADARRRPGRASGAASPRRSRSTATQRTVTLTDGEVIDVRPPRARHRRAGVRAADPGPATPTPRHVHVLRSLDDCRDVGRPRGQRQARGRARRRLARHRGGLRPAPPRRPGDRRRPGPTPDVRPARRRPPSDVLAGRLGDLGIDVRAGTSVAEVITAYDEIVAVRLTDGSVLAADLMLVSCGVRANGEPGSRRPAWRSTAASSSTTGWRRSDPRISAIGDCAQSPQGMTGLLAPGWRAGRAAGRGHGLGRASSLERSVEPRRPEGDAAQGGRRRPGHAGRPAVAGRARRPGAHPERPGRAPARRARRPRSDTSSSASPASARPTSPRSVSIVFERGTPMPVDPLALLLPDKRVEEVVAGADARRHHGLPLQRGHQGGHRQGLGGRLPHRRGARREHPGHDRLRRLHERRLRPRRLAQRERPRDPPTTPHSPPTRAAATSVARA